MKLHFIGKIGGYVVQGHGPEAIGQFVVVRGKRVYFDFDELFGPLIVDPFGEPMKRQPVREDDPFWTPFNKWLDGYWKAKSSPQAQEAYLTANNGTAGYIERKHTKPTRAALNSEKTHGE